MAARSRVEFDEREYIREREVPRRPPVREFDDVDIHISERERDRVPAFMREERRTDAGPLVLRQREIETIERPRHRSPSPSVHVRERIVERARSVSPTRHVHEDVRIRQVERVREPSRGPPVERVRTRIVERERSPSPTGSTIERLRTRIVERKRSPSPAVRERIRVVERTPAPSPPPPPPPVIKGPTIEREVITHYRDYDHGMKPAPKPPSPPPRHTHRDTEIDIYTSRNKTDVDIHKSTHTHVTRGRSVERPSRTWDDEVVVHSHAHGDRKHLHVDIERRRSVSRGRRAQSAAPPPIDDEAYEITSRIDSRGKMGEAWNGITKDWTIVDVPPGTERVVMDGAGGASAEIKWQKYSGVRRSKFIPERDTDKSTVVSSTTTTVSDTPEHSRERRVSVQIYKDREEKDVELEKVTDRRVTIRNSGPSSRKSDMWTEITKDLVCREAIEELGYEYEETELFYYIIEYLRYEDVLRLVQLSDRIRQARKDRALQIEWERERREEWEHYHTHTHSHSRSRPHHDNEHIVEREVVYDSRPGKSYRR